MASHYLRKYGVEATVNFELYELDGTDLIATAASATGDINLIRDEAGAEQLDADAFVDEGVVYSLVVSATEMTAKRITIYLIDQSSPKIWLDKVLIIETYGNASAQHPFDLGTAATAMRGTDNVVLAGPTKTEMDNAIATVIADTEDIQTILGTPANFMADVSGITAAGPTKGEMDTAHGLLATPAQVATELGTYDAATGTELSNHDGKLDTVDANIDKLVTAIELDGAVYRFTENALEEAPAGGNGGGASVDEIWDEPLADHQTEGSMGEALNDATEITLEED